MNKFLTTSFAFFFAYVISLDIQAAGLPSNIASLVEDSAPAVVNITSRKEVSTQNSFRGMPPELERFFGIPRGYEEAPQQKRKAEGYGSGFIFKENYILTNFHVVDGASEVIVSLVDRREYVAEVVGIDALSDLAVLKINGKKLPKVKVGDSDSLRVGDWVVAIGSPYSFDFSVTAGIVSAKGRSIQNNNIGNYVPFLQTDVAINPGNSGGPLFDLKGEVVGINSQIYSRSGGYQGLAFAIPINVAIDVAEQIIDSGVVARGYLGVRVGEVDNDLAEALGMDKPYGALINDLEEGESGDNGGLIPGDVILDFDGKEIKFSADLPHVVGQIKPNTESIATIFRDGEEMQLTFILGELPSSDKPFVPAKTNNNSDMLGLQIEEIDRDNPQMANLEDGVIVSKVLSGSPASGKIQRGDIITHIRYRNMKYKIDSFESFSDTIEKLESGSIVAVFGKRNNARFIVPIRLN